MKKLSLASCVVMLFQLATAAPILAQELVTPQTPTPQTPTPQTPPTQTATPQAPIEAMPDINGMPVARPSQVQDDLEGRGLIRSAIGQAPNISAITDSQTGPVIASPVPRPNGGEAAIEESVAAPSIAVTKKLIVVPPMIVDMMIGDTILIGPRPGFGYGFGPGLPLDEISVLPEMNVPACSCVSMPIPEACVLPTGAELRAVLMIGNHMQLVTVELTDPCMMTVSLPRMWMSAEMHVTLLVGLNTGDVLYEQPMLMTLPQG